MTAQASGDSGERVLHPDLSAAERRRLHERAVALFDRGRFFEAHEPWEEIWRSTSPEPRDLWQGLVQIAAGFHHWFDRGRAAPAARLLRRGLRRLSTFDVVEAGVDLDRSRATIEQWIGWLESGARGPAPPRPRLYRRR